MTTILPRLHTLGRVLLTAAAGLVVLWATIHVVARAWQDELGGRDVRLRVVYWGDTYGDQITREMIAKFEAAHPNIGVEPIHVNNANFEAKLKTMFAAGDPPDVFYLPYDSVPQYASLGLLEPLGDDLVAADVAWADDFYPALIKGFRFDPATQYRGEGPLWGLPKDFSPLAMYVNVDLLEAAGVPVAHDGWTWEEFEHAARKVDALGPDIHGAFLGLWPDSLLAVLWSHGGELFHLGDDGRPDFTRLATDNPRTLEALERVRRLRLDEGIVYNTTGVARNGGEEFFTGRVGIIGPLGRWATARYKNIETFSFDVVPLPHSPGVQPTSPMLTVAWAVSAASEHKTAATKLALFMAGPDGQETVGGLGLSVPALRSVAHSDSFLRPGEPPANTPVFLDIADQMRAQHWPREREFRDILDAEQSAALQLGSRTVKEALANVERRWANELASPLKADDHAPMRWRPVLILTLAIVAVAVGLMCWRASREKLGPLDRAHERSGFGFIGVWILGFVVLTAGPMLLSGVLAFTRWSAVTPLGNAEFVGFDNFVHMFGYDSAFWQSLRVTGYFVFLAIPIGQLAALAVALLMNTEVRGISIFRTIYFVPSVITGVALATLWLALLNNDYGLINKVLYLPMSWFGQAPPDWFGRDAQWAAIPAFVMMGLWGVGSAMVIYLAGLKSIPRSLLEAATIDGASRWHRLCHVTLPMLSPLIFFNLVMGIIGSFQVFTQAFVMTGRGPDDATLFYVLYLYLQAFEFHNMGYASALAWVLFVLILAVTLLAFRGSRGLVHYEGLKS